MKISFKTILLNALLFCFGLMLVWLAFQGQDFSAIVGEFKNLKYSYIFISVMVLGFSHIIRAIRWNQLMFPLGIKPGLWDSFGALMIGYLANLALPRAGEITRCGILSRKTGASVESLFGTVITERIWDLFSLMVITACSLIFQYKDITQLFHQNILEPLLAKSPPPLYFLIVFLTLVILIIGFRFILKKFDSKNNSVYFRLRGIWKGIFIGLQSILFIKNKFLFIMYTVGIWGGYAVSSWILFYSVQSTSGLGLNAALIILTAGAFGMVAPVQGGIGAYHYMVSHALLLYQISLSSGLVYATVNHSVGILLILIVGTCSLLLFLINRPQNKGGVDK